MTLLNDLITLIVCKDFGEKISLAQNLKTKPIHPLKPYDKVLDLRELGRPEGFKWVLPREVLKRSFVSEQDRATFLHALANIELLAIELPALCLLRFGSNDLDFIQTQLHIIAEEAQHFSQLKNRLSQMKVPFGSLPCHKGLWDYAWQCQSELEHQIVIPCYLEAKGLDVTDRFIESFKRIKDEASAAILTLILNDEIEHVKAGQNYIQKYAFKTHKCADQVFEATLTRFFNGKIKSKIKIHTENRKKAGFSKAMLSALS